MARIPIDIVKVKVTNRRGKDETVYQLRLEEKGASWIKTLTCDRDDLIRFKNRIDEILATATTADILNISKEQAQIIDAAHEKDNLCKGCSLKMTDNCVTCLFEIKSPLERQLFLELRKSFIPFQMQYALGHNGETLNIADNQKTNNYSNVLTVADFYIEKRDVRLCVYTDGHTYHERTEDQATRDRKIDRKLQELGYKVLRYTGKDVREKLDKVVGEIRKWTN